MMNHKLPVELLIRGLDKEDEAFVYATYLRHHWFAKTNKTTLPKDTFMRLLHNRLEILIEEGRVEIASLNDDPSVIIGYSIIESAAKTFVYIKKAFRNLGIEQLLTERNLTNEKH